MNAVAFCDVCYDASVISLVLFCLTVYCFVLPLGVTKNRITVFAHHFVSSSYRVHCTKLNINQKFEAYYSIRTYQ
ncbi:hypothetical protein L1887_21194 [Cichorium endivia]|nr:hypothetical protein L1887_21194 [Cichorium endivia]